MSNQNLEQLSGKENTSEVVFSERVEIPKTLQCVLRSCGFVLGMLRSSLISCSGCFIVLTTQGQTTAASYCQQRMSC